MTAAPAARPRVSTTHRLTAADYTDQLTMQLAAPTDRPALAWLRQTLEHANPLWRYSLPPGWRALRLGLERTHTPGTVLGWPVVSERDDEVALAARSGWGFDARLILAVEGAQVRFSTALRFDRARARALWLPAEVPHRLMVASMLRRAARTM